MVSTDTLERTDTDVFSLEDFEAPCDIAVALVVGRVVMGHRPCEHPAKWVGENPCCGRTVLVCQPHKDSPTTYYCVGCAHEHQELLNWREL